MEAGRGFEHIQEVNCDEHCSREGGGWRVEGQGVSQLTLSGSGVLECRSTPFEELSR